MLRPTVLLGAASLALLVGPSFPTREEALAQAFGSRASFTRATHWLSATQRARAATLAGAPVRAAAEVWTARDAEGRLLGSAVVDARTVRTHGQTVLYAITPDGRLARTVVLGFDEPRDYLPKPAWYDALAGKALDDELQLKRGVHAVTGATLTARATVAGAREALAVRKALDEPPQP